MSETTTPRQEQAVARRKQIVDVARQLFAEKGFEATSVRDVHRAIGASDGLLYHYFPSKTELLYAVLDDGFANMRKARLADDVADEVSVPEGLRITGRRLWTRWVEHEQEMKILLRDHDALAKDGNFSFPEAFYRSAEGLVEFLQRRIDRGELREIDARCATRQFIGSLLGLYVLQVVIGGERVHHIDPDEFLEQSIDLLWQGWRPEGNGNTKTRRNGR